MLRRCCAGNSAINGDNSAGNGAGAAHFGRRENLCRIGEENAKLGTVHRYTEAGPGPVGSAMLVEFELNGQKFSALNGGPQFTFNESVSIVVPCADQAEVDSYWDRLSDGGQEIACGWLKDKYGLCWQIVPAVFFEMIAGPDPAAVARVMRAMMDMTRFDLAGLEQAYVGR